MCTRGWKEPSSMFEAIQPCGCIECCAERDECNKTVNDDDDHHGSDDLLFIRKLKRGGLSAKDIHMVIDALDGICKHCLDADASCNCWND